jgi:hypothetical protein
MHKNCVYLFSCPLALDMTIFTTYGLSNSDICGPLHAWARTLLEPRHAYIVPIAHLDSTIIIITCIPV